MKKIAILFAVLFACFALPGPAAVCAEEETAAAAAYAEESIDLDLSSFSGTVVYAQIYQMAVHPEDYIGKVIRLAGWYDVYVDSETDMVYTVCYIPDASACCAQGIEFVWGGAHDFPDGYPEPGIEITVTGRFETYFEGEWEYMRLADAEIQWEEPETRDTGNAER